MPATEFIEVDANRVLVMVERRMVGTAGPKLAVDLGDPAQTVGPEPGVKISPTQPPPPGVGALATMRGCPPVPAPEFTPPPVNVVP